MATPIDISGETVNKLVEVSDGFWMAATSHHPGGSVKSMPSINNRCLVFRLEEDGAPTLVVINAVDPTVIPELRRIETETGLKISRVISPGGGHHLNMPGWHDEFTEATFYLCPIRAPRTMNCAELVKSPRVKLLDLENPLPEFAGQLEAVVFDGLLGFPDVKSPFEGAKENLWGMMKMMVMMVKGPNDPVDELWLRHVATDTVIGGENLGWMFTAPDYERLPGMIKKMMKAEQVYLPSGGRKVGDLDRVKAKWTKIIGWPVQTLISYHDTVGFAWTKDAAGALKTAIADAEQTP